VKVVVALGGNAITGQGGSLEPEALKQRVSGAAAALADIARGCDAVITHGNGPQVGMLSMQSRAYPAVSPYPLDVIGAESDGMIGYLLEREFASIFPTSEVATLLTQVEVDADDPAFDAPTKPIGPALGEEEAKDLTERMGWQFRREAAGFRRVVPSPLPKRIRELRTIELLVDAGVLVVSGGGGGIPVVVSEEEGLQGVEAVVDKDRTAALLAAELHADALLILTNVTAVYADWPEPCKQAIRCAPPEIAGELELDPGSMGPKLEAACDFVARTGQKAMIGSLFDASRVFQGLAGTRIDTSGERSFWPEAPQPHADD
jgi:carbamate kinase